MGVIDTVKSHPIIAGGVAVLAIIIIVVLSHSGAAPTVQTAPAGATADGTALQTAQLQAQTDANAIGGQIQLANIASATQLGTATITAQSTDNANYLAYEGHSEDTAAALKSSLLQSSLAAQVAGQQAENAKIVALASFSNQEDLATIAANQNIATQQILASAVESANQTTQLQIASNERLQANQQAVNLSLATQQAQQTQANLSWVTQFGR